MSPVPAEEVLARLDPADRDAVVAFRDAVRERYGPQIRDIRIFGSKVRGDDHDESDIDVLVLLDGGNDHSTRSEIIRLALDISPWLSPVVRDFDAYHAPISRASGFYEAMRRESVRL